MQGYNIRYYAIGHSFLLHGHFDGWQIVGEWGMAASTPKNDYFHKIQKGLTECLPCKLSVGLDNYFELESACAENTTNEDYINLAKTKKLIEDLNELKPNVVTVLIGENIRTDDENALEMFYDFFV